VHHTRRIFEKADLNSDGQLDFNEFFAYAYPHASSAVGRSAAASSAPNAGRSAGTGPCRGADGVPGADASAAARNGRLLEQAGSLLRGKGGGDGDGDSDGDDEPWPDLAAMASADGRELMNTLLDSSAARRTTQRQARLLEREASLAADREQTAAAATAAAAQSLSAEYLRKLTEGAADSVALLGRDHSAPLSPTTRSALQLQFRRFDLKNTGRLEFDEFSPLCNHLAHGFGTTLSGLQLMSLFSEADLDGSHAVDFSEWCAFRPRLLERMRELSSTGAKPTQSGRLPNNVGQSTALVVASSVAGGAASQSEPWPGGNYHGAGERLDPTAIAQTLGLSGPYFT